MGAATSITAGPADRRTVTMSRSIPALVLALLLTAGALAVEPGVDVAVPRVALSQVNDGFVFQPAILVVERGDWVRWTSVATGMTHTTTSGNPCVASGLWNSPLSPGGQFTRQFADNPGILPYFCGPHCGLNMTGQIRVTPPIVLQASDTFGTLSLAWTGGGTTYRVFRSDVRAFAGPGTVSFAPTGSDSGTSFSDASQPAPGAILYYLVMNKF